MRNHRHISTEDDGAASTAAGIGIIAAIAVLITIFAWHPWSAGMVH